MKLRREYDFLFFFFFLLVLFSLLFWVWLLFPVD